MDREGTRATLLIVGAGGLGRAILIELCRARLPVRIVASSRTGGSLQSFVNLVRLAAVAADFPAPLEAVELDLDRPEQAAETIDSIRPDWILMTATRQSWWLPSLLPGSTQSRLQEAGYGLWLPVHFDLTRRLMRVLEDARVTAPVVTASYPDVVNCILGRIGLAPFCGFGNVEELVSQVSLRVAQRRRVPLSEVRVLLAAHHALQVAIQSRKTPAVCPPFAVQIDISGEGRMGEEEARTLVLEPWELPSGPETHVLTAACAARLFHNLLRQKDQILHLPGPGGLPGGYPVNCKGRELQVQELEGKSLDDLIQINQESHRFDGIESIRPDGTVRFRTRTREIAREVLQYDCGPLVPSEAQERATELIVRFRELATKKDIELPG